MSDIEVVAQKVQAERWEASRVVSLPTGGPECLQVVRETEVALTDALTGTGKDFAHFEVKWTCTVVGTTPTEPAKIDLHPGAPGARRLEVR